MTIKIEFDTNPILRLNQQIKLEDKNKLDWVNLTYLGNSRIDGKQMYNVISSSLTKNSISTLELNLNNQTHKILNIDTCISTNNFYANTAGGNGMGPVIPDYNLENKENIVNFILDYLNIDKSILEQKDGWKTITRQIKLTSLLNNTNDTNLLL